MAKLFIILALLSPTLSRAAYIAGQIRYAEPGAQVELRISHRYIDGHDEHIIITLDDQSHFAIAVKMPEPQLAFLLFNDERLPIFLSPDDTLTFKADAFQFPLAVSFGGNAGPNNHLLQKYLRLAPIDFREFNNIRFKIGQHWASVETPMSQRMENLLPPEFKAYLDTLRAASTELLEYSLPAYAPSPVKTLAGEKALADKQSPNTITLDFAQWLAAETAYFWAYHLLVYGHVYAGRHSIQPEFFDFLYEAPIYCESIGSDSYRQFLLAIMARQQTKTEMEDEEFWANQYNEAGKLLSGKPLAFFRSEVISTAFSAEKYRDLLPIYTHFLQTNEYPDYDDKVEGLYQKYARVLPGSQAPAFEAADTDGYLVTLEQLRGKVVYLNFWASWCGACLRKMEFVDEYEAELSANGIEIVNVSIDENSVNWLSALAEHQFKGRHLLASAGLGANIAATFGVEAVPQYFIIGRDGTFADKAATSQPAAIRAQLLRAAGKR